MSKTNHLPKILVLLMLFCLNAGAWADNVVQVSSAEGAPDEEVTIHVSLLNTDEIASLQISIPLDENLSFVEGSGIIGNRCGSHSLTVGVKDGVLNVLVYSIQMAAFEGSSGEVASFRLKLGNQPVTSLLTPTKTVLTNCSGATMNCHAESGTVITFCAKAQYSTMEIDFGEVPIRSTYEQSFTVTNVGNSDLVITGVDFSDVNVFSSSTSFPLTVSPGASRVINVVYAPVERGNIQKKLFVRCNSISKLNTITLKAQPFAVNELHIQDASGISDEEVTIHMTMNNMDPVSGFQIEFDMPEQLKYVDGSFELSSRKQDHIVIASSAGNKLRFVAYSSSDKPMTGDDGEIGSFRVLLSGSYGASLMPTKTVLAATIENRVENVVSAVYGGYVSISSPRINTDNLIDFGAVSITSECEKTWSVYNSGSAPLTINRVVFNNENLSVKEQLPLVIPAGDGNDLTVVYSSVEQKAFEASMQIYSNDPDLRLKTIEVKGSRFAPNFLELSVPGTTTEENLKIELSMDNYDDVTGIQFDLEYPDEYKPFDNNYTIESRANGMSVQAVPTFGNTLRCFCYFMSDNSIESGSGKVMTIELKPSGESVPEGTYKVYLKNIKLGTNDMVDKYAGEDLEATFVVKERLLGDINEDDKVNGMDIVEMVDYIMNNGYASTADLYPVGAPDGVINGMDLVEEVDLILSQENNNQ